MWRSIQPLLLIIQLEAIAPGRQVSLELVFVIHYESAEDPPESYRYRPNDHVRISSRTGSTHMGTARANLELGADRRRS